FESDLSPVVVPLTLGLWLTVIGSKPSTLPEGHAIQCRYARSALLWSACYVPVMLGLQYFPDRYKLHLLLPLVIASATGFALLEQRGMHLADSWVPVAHGYKRRLAATLLGLPSGVLLGPALAPVLGVAIEDPGRVRVKIASVVTCWGLATLTAERLA